MPPIKEPIDFDDLPDDVGQLKAIIFCLAFQKNAVIKARDDHINTLLDKNQSLECSLQLCRESLAAADGASSPAPASEDSESERSFLTAHSSPLSTPSPPPSSSSDTHSSSDFDNDGLAAEMGSGGSDDLDSDETASDTESGVSADLENDEPTGGSEREEASPDPDNDESGSETESRTSPTPSIRSRTRGASRVSKTQKRGGRSGSVPAQAIGRARRRRVWPYSGGEVDLSDLMEGGV